MIIPGDWEACWSGLPNDDDMILFYGTKPYSILAVDGNHEGFPSLNAYPEEEWNGGDGA